MQRNRRYQLMFLLPLFFGLSVCTMWDTEQDSTRLYFVIKPWNTKQWLKGQVHAYTCLCGVILLCLRKSVGKTSRFLIESFPNEQGISGGPGQSTTELEQQQRWKIKEALGNPKPWKLRQLLQNLRKSGDGGERKDREGIGSLWLVIPIAWRNTVQPECIQNKRGRGEKLSPLQYLYFEWEH